MEEKLRLYKAVIWVQGSDNPGLRVSVLAENSSEAKKLLESEHGEETVFNLHNEEDAARSR